jgi:transposase
MEIILSRSVREELKRALKKSRTVDARNRLCSLLSYDSGKSVEEISAILHLDRKTVYAYLHDYLEKNKTHNDPRGGSSSKLSSSQAEELKKHLRGNVYLYVKDMIVYIEAQYRVKYTVSGLTQWLKRQGFCYKKPVPIPGKLSPEKQEIFIKEYKNLKDSLLSDEAIVFVDAVHPAYQSQTVGGWILKGEQKHLPTTAKQERLHYTGGISLSDCDEAAHKIILNESETVDQDTIIDFFKRLETDMGKERLHAICDNAMYFKGKEVKKYLETSKIQIHYLPSYSPNLNPIERLWKIMRENVYYNKYYKDFKAFREAIEFFFTARVSQFQKNALELAR